MNTLPAVNQQEIARRITMALAKIANYKERIADIEQLLNDAKNEFDTVSAIVNYAEAHERRRTLLVGLFVYPNDYGDFQPESPDLVVQFRERLTFLEGSMDSYERKIKRRRDGISLMERDIELLKKIQLHYSRSPFAHMGIVDGA